MTLKIITTSDGSHSILDESRNETYHSTHGAIQESIHVFITHGLSFRLQETASPLTIFEVGFGTGLNALLTLQYAAKLQARIRYVTIEPHPLPEEIWSSLNYAEALSLSEEFKAIHHAPWGAEISLLDNFSLLKVKTTLQDTDLPRDSADIVYYDAFAPSKQPELWEYPMLEKIATGLRSGGVLVTYCAKGQLKRDLKSLGLQLDTLPGPPGKKEMVRARKM